MSATALTFAQNNSQRFVDELKALLRIPSISTLPEHDADTRRAAEFVAAELGRIGMENVLPTQTTPGAHANGHPPTYADWLHATALNDKPAPTVLIYDHYDV